MTTKILTGHVLDKLAELPAESVHCMVTSPPYYGLRDYQTIPQVWGGDPRCRHVFRIERVTPQAGGTGPASTKQISNGGSQGSVQTPIEYAFCRHCNAWRGHLGLEPTHDLYLDHLVEVFRAVGRVLRHDGTIWIVIGDSYYNYRPGRGQPIIKQTLASNVRDAPVICPRRGNKLVGLKEKDLMLIPARLAIRLQDDGWYVRSDIVWVKSNPMPESVTDRPTQAHEQIWMLSKSAHYFYDDEAVKEDAIYAGDDRGARADNRRSVPLAKSISGVTPNMRNMRNVWYINPEPFPEAHFATFPTEIPIRAILAGTSAKGVCGKCGAPWVRVVERDPSNWSERKANGAISGNRAIGQGGVHGAGMSHDLYGAAAVTTGWQRSCSCRMTGNPVPATVLDPFLGSGTTTVVADRLNRNSIGIELNPDYAKMAARRARNDWGYFNQPVVELRA